MYEVLQLLTGVAVVRLGEEAIRQLVVLYALYQGREVNSIRPGGDITRFGPLPQPRPKPSRKKRKRR